MKIKLNHIKVIGFACALGLSACAEQMEVADTNSSTQVVVSSIGITGRGSTDTDTAPDGAYYFGYTSKQNVFSYTRMNISGGTIDAVAAYWENINQEKVALSNTIDLAGDSIIDILWGSSTSYKVKLDFTLTHRMAQAVIKLGIPKGWKIKSICLTNLRNKYSFENKIGDVIVAKDKAPTNIEVETIETIYSVLLPPQEKEDNSALTVVVNDGSKDRTYSRKLPYAMAQEIGSDQYEDIPLKFRAGYCLEISATIPETANNEIQFTYATLKDWQAVAGGTISAHPAGIYTAASWNDFAKAYNENDAVRLCKYGTKNNDNKWTFTLKRSIDLTGKAVTKVTNFKSDDTFNADNNCTITGTTADELGITGSFITKTND